MEASSRRCLGIVAPWGTGHTAGGGQGMDLSTKVKLARTHLTSNFSHYVPPHGHRYLHVYLHMHTHTHHITLFIHLSFFSLAFQRRKHPYIKHGSQVSIISFKTSMIIIITYTSITLHCFKTHSKLSMHFLLRCNWHLFLFKFSKPPRGNLWINILVLWTTTKKFWEIKMSN